MEIVLRLEGLDCANCASELERRIAQIEGIDWAVVAFVTQTLTLEYQTEDALKRAIEIANHFEEVRVIEGNKSEKRGGCKPWKNKRFWEWLRVAIALSFFIGGYLLKNFSMQIGALVCYAIAYFCVGYTVLVRTVKNVVKGKIFDENFLMTVASIGAVLLGETEEAVLVMLLYQIGETLQGMAVDSSRSSIVDIINLKAERAIVFKGKTQRQVSPEEICVGDILLVKHGEKVPVDGVLIGENALLDNKSLTGESVPKSVKMNGELLSGCINAGETFVMRATKSYENSAVKRILDLVENASSKKANAEKFITKFARYYTPIVCGLALLFAIVAPFIHSLVVDNALNFVYFSRWVQSALTFLVVSCPCALIISVPLTYFSGIGVCAKVGALVKGATYLDLLAKADRIAFDKTGTLTEGNFSVVGVFPKGEVTKEELLFLVTAVEKYSAHPIAKAFADFTTPYETQDVKEVAGGGLTAVIDGNKVVIGNADFLFKNATEVPLEKSVYTAIHVAKNGEYLGKVEVGDKIREETPEALNALKKLGISRLALLTGDDELRAKSVGAEVGISEVYAKLLPDGKVRKANELKEGGTLVYVGDGINDAPVMYTADCAVSMGKLGSAVAVEASDVVLISDNVKALPFCLKIARKTRKIVLQNIVFSIVMKFVFMALGVFGVLPLGVAVFADVGVMLLAVINALRVKK